MALAEFDAILIERCLERVPQAWEDFVERFIGLVCHVVQQTCEARNIPLSPILREDLVQEVFVAILADNYVVLRRFRGNSSLATYLTVVARRVVVKSILQKKLVPEFQASPDSVMAAPPEMADAAAGDEVQRVDDKDQVEHLLAGLSERDAAIVRMYHLEQKTYAEIASALNVPENSVGPTLSRARENMRRTAEETKE